MPRRHALFVIFAVCLTHGWSLAGGYVWDDTYNVGDNQSIRSLSSIPDFFQEPWASSAPIDSHARRKNRGLYRPLTQVTYTLDYAIYGDRAVGFHTTNVIIHCISVLLLLGLARRFLSARASLCCALLWAIHPLHTEAVALISYRTSLLAACFGLGAMTIRICADRPWLGLSLRSLFFLGAVFSKEDGLVFAALIPLFDLFIENTSLKKTVQNALPLLAISLLYLVVRSQIIEPGLETHFFLDTSVTQRSASLLSILWLYASLMVVPFPLTPFYDWDILGAPGWSSMSVWLGLGALLGLVALVARFRKHREAAFLALGVLLALLPYAHFVPFTVGAAERFLYVPSIFAILLVGWLMSRSELQRSMSRGFRRGLIALFFAWFGLASAWTAYRHSQWWSYRSITEATARAYPNSFNAWQAVAQARVQDNDWAEAGEAYSTIQARFPCVLSIWPTLDQIEANPKHKLSAKELEALNAFEKKCRPQIENASVPEIRDAFLRLRTRIRALPSPAPP